MTEAVYYNIYRTELPSGTIQSIDQVAANNYVDSDVNEGSGYIYNVSAVKGSGEESALSAPVTVDEIPGQRFRQYQRAFRLSAWVRVLFS